MKIANRFCYGKVLQCEQIFNDFFLDLCSSGHDCHPAAQCVFDSNEMRQKCICDQGFEGDGLTRCTPLPGR